MMRLILLLTAALLGITGCDRARVSAEGEYRRPVVRDDSPRIRTFGVIDSYLRDSEDYAYGSMELDPEQDYGIFDVYWDVSNNYRDYTVDLFINDIPGLDGAIPIGIDYCGPYEACDNYGQQVCEYSLDYRMGCGLDLIDAADFAQPMEILVHQWPDTLYISLEVCPLDSGYCDVESIPVTVY